MMLTALFLKVLAATMTLDLANYEDQATNAVKAFWGNRGAAAKAQIDAGNSDQGERASVTAGKNMDGFFDLIIDIIKANGLENADIHLTKSLVTLPGYFRPTKQWDIVVMYEGSLVAVIELKSQAGPSFGNNFNNRTEEALGSAVDFWTAYREGAFGDQVRPYLGWLMLVEDADASRKPVNGKSPHFEVFDAFDGASYLERYDILCRKLVQESLYSNACLIAAPRSSVESGEYECLSDLTSLKRFVSGLAGHVAAAAT